MNLKEIRKNSSEAYLDSKGTNRKARLILDLLDLREERKNHKLANTKNPSTVERIRMSYIEKTRKIRDIAKNKGIKMGSLVSVNWHGKTKIGFVEELRLDKEGICFNLERNRYLGQNSWSNYILKGILLDNVTLLQTRPNMQSVA